MTREQCLSFALYAAEVGNQLAFSHNLKVRDMSVSWLRTKLFREWDMLAGTGLAASHIATEYNREATIRTHAPTQPDINEGVLENKGT